MILCIGWCWLLSSLVAVTVTVATELTVNVECRDDDGRGTWYGFFDAFVVRMEI
jgi:hypothetical protein